MFYCFRPSMLSYSIVHALQYGLIALTVMKLSRGDGIAALARTSCSLLLLFLSTTPSNRLIDVSHIQPNMMNRADGTSRYFEAIPHVSLLLVYTPSSSMKWGHHVSQS